LILAPTVRLLPRWSSALEGHVLDDGGESNASPWPGRAAVGYARSTSQEAPLG
jgi:hypothetical protein